MDVYISCSSFELEEHVDTYELIREEILRMKHKIPADWLGRTIKKLKKGNNSLNNNPSIRNEGIKAIEESSCLIADVSISSSSVGYQIAHALSKKIPVLCLYSEEFGRMRSPQIIDASDMSLLKIMSYNKKNVGKIIKNFINELPTEKLIKFNFIITPEIDQYLSWGASKLGISKSEFLRGKVNNIIEADIDYGKKD